MNNPKVFIVEDEKILLDAIAKKLSLQGIDSIGFTSGQEALEYARNSEEAPDLIWLDYYLKDLSGLEFLTQLKKYEKWNGLPVVVVSNSASPEKVTNMLTLGARKYILKAQYRLEDIVTLVKGLIEEGQSSDNKKNSDNNVTE